MPHEDLEPEEHDAILRFLAGGKPLRRQRGRGHQRLGGLPIVPELLDETELFFARLLPEGDHHYIVKLAGRWKQAGIAKPAEIKSWLGIGVTVSNPVIAGEFALQGISARLAALNAGRYGGRNYSNFTYYQLVTQGFCDVAEVCRMMQHKGELGRTG